MCDTVFDNCVTLTATVAIQCVPRTGGQVPGNVATNISSYLSWVLSINTSLNILKFAMSTLEIL